MTNTDLKQGNELAALISAWRTHIEFVTPNPEMILVNKELQINVSINLNEVSKVGERSLKAEIVKELLPSNFMELYIEKCIDKLVELENQFESL